MRGTSRAGPPLTTQAQAYAARADTTTNISAGTMSILGWGRVTTITCSPGRSTLRIAAFCSAAAGALAAGPGRVPRPQVHDVAGGHHMFMARGIDHQERAVFVQARGMAHDLGVAREVGPDLLAEGWEEVLHAFVQRWATGHAGGGVAVGVAETPV